ncbi:MAG: hypothetical protein KDD35_00690 [Bdellovibrionales bacterium]|nr:hypothetical protein [Bdellovibrionales bacterium]
MRACIFLLPVFSGFIFSCGGNPQKNVGGLSIRSKFLSTNTGVYSGNGEYYSFSEDGSVWVGKQFLQSFRLEYDNQNSMVLTQISQPQVSFKLDQVDTKDTETIRSTLDEEISHRIPQEISFYCVYGQKGFLNDFVILPEKKKDLQYSYEIADQMARGSRFFARFSLDGETETKLGKTKIEGKAIKAFPQTILREILKSFCEKDKNARIGSYLQFQNSLGLISYDETKLEFNPPGGKTQNIYHPGSAYLLKESIEKIDLSEAFWPHLRAKYYSAEAVDLNSNPKLEPWKIRDPKESLVFSADKRTLTWTRELSSEGSCGFKFVLDIKSFFIQTFMKAPPEFIEVDYQLKEAQIINGGSVNQNQTNCREIRMIEQMKNTSGPDKTHLYLRLDENSGFGIAFQAVSNIYFKQDLIEQALPWSDEHQRLEFSPPARGDQ